MNPVINNSSTDFKMWSLRRELSIFEITFCLWSALKQKQREWLFFVSVWPKLSKEVFDFISFCVPGEPRAKETVGGICRWWPSVPLWAPGTGEKPADPGEWGSWPESLTHHGAAGAYEYPVWCLEEQVPGQQVWNRWSEGRFNFRAPPSWSLLIVPFNRNWDNCCHHVVLTVVVMLMSFQSHGWGADKCQSSSTETDERGARGHPGPTAGERGVLQTHAPHTQVMRSLMLNWWIT